MTSFCDLYRIVDGTPGYIAEGVKMDVALLFNEAMKRQSITGKELARRLHCSPAYVSKMLRGDKNFGVLELAKFSAALGYKVEIKLVPIIE